MWTVRYNLEGLEKHDSVYFTRWICSGCGHCLLSPIHNPHPDNKICPECFLRIQYVFNPFEED